MILQRPKILIVEDEAIVAKGIAKSLAQFGYEVIGTVYTGERALMYAEQYRPDLVMMDIVLKGKMDGIEAAEAIRCGLNIPIIFLTAYSDKDTLDRAKVTQPHGYLLKPYYEKDLHTCIETTLFKHHQEKIIKEKKIWLSSTLASIGDAVIATDTQEKVAFLNPEAQNLTGWSEKEANGKPIQEILNLYNLATGEEIESPTTKVLREEIKVKLPRNSILISRDKQKIPIEDTGTPIKDPSGKTIGAVLIFQKMQAQPHSEKDYQSFIEKVEKRNQALAEFASIASHDLKEPLRKVQILSDRLKINLGDCIDEKSKDYLDRLHSTTKHMEQLLNDLLEYSRLTAEPPRFSDVNLEPLVQKIISTLDTRLEETEGKVEIIKLPTVEAEPVQMVQLFQNLISNSLKYRQPDVPPEITLESKKSNNGDWEIQIKDNGMGFDIKNLDLIFQPFRRLHSKTDIEGNGLGLAICKKIIESHGGKITAKSEPNKGSTFILTLPEKQHPRVSYL